MRDVDPIEAALARLMPVALSEAGERSIHETLDELAGSLPAKRYSTGKGWTIGLGIAAAVAIAVFLTTRPSLQAPAVASQEKFDSPVEWLANSDRVESLQDEGRISGVEGDALQAVSLRVIEENTLRDRETGYTFNISEPRDELVLMPVTSF